MSANERLLNRVREALIELPDVQEKRMFSGVCFMIDAKLCICVNQQEILCRVNPTEFESVLELDGTRPMRQRERVAKGYVFVHEDVINNKKDLDFWVEMALAYNKIAKASKNKKR